MDIFLNLLVKALNGEFTTNELLLFITGFILGITAGIFIAKLFIHPKPSEPIHEKIYICSIVDENERDSLQLPLDVPATFMGSKPISIRCPFIKQGKCSKIDKKCLIFNTCI